MYLFRLVGALVELPLGEEVEVVGLQETELLLS